MYKAVDETGNLIYITDTEPGHQYYCPGCHGLLGVKAEHSKVIRKHFFHKNGEECNYGIDHDMSEWHYQWQLRFPTKCREIPIPIDKPIHRADVWIYGRVIEFQHSPISEDQFTSRNEFYTNCGFFLTWVFDMTSHVKEIKEFEIRLKKKNPLFLNYSIDNSKYRFYFEIDGKMYLIKRYSSENNAYEFDERSILSREMFVAIYQRPPMRYSTAGTQAKRVQNGGSSLREAPIDYITRKRASGQRRRY